MVPPIAPSPCSASTLAISPVGWLARAYFTGARHVREFCFPPVCPGCDRGLPGDSAGACPDCLEELSSLRIEPGGRCPRCFQLCDDLGACEYCRSRRVYFDQHISLAPMQGLWREVVHRWKYENDRRLWRLFWAPGMHLNPEWAGAQIDVLQRAAIQRIVWIDSGVSGRQLRNYQPCADVARALAAGLAPPYGAGADLRKRKGRQQSAKSYVDRFFAIHDSFEYHGPGTAERVLLVEDVFTTGATANEAARVLKKNGALQVIVFSLLLRDGCAA